MDMERDELGRYTLAVLRIGMGWLLLWSFFDKVFGLGFSTPAGSGWIDGVSPSSFITYVASGPLADFYISLGGNVFVDILMMAGLCKFKVSDAIPLAELKSLSKEDFLKRVIPCSEIHKMLTTEMR